MKRLWICLTVILLAAISSGQNLPNINTNTKGQLPTSRLSATGIAGLCLETDGNGNVVLQTCSGGGGSGTVTTFSAGTLSPIFTTSVTNASTTPSLTFSLSSTSAHSFLGNNTGTSGVPGYVSITAADLPGVFAQNTTSTAHQFFNSYNSALGTFGKAQPDYSDLTGTPVLPSTLANATHKWFNSYSSVTGLFTQTQPDYSDLTGTPVLPANTTTTTHNFFTAYNSSTGLFSIAQPATSDLSDFPSQATHSGQFLTTNGTVLSWGSPSGAGSVTSFSSGNLSPLFTTSVATPTSTPSQTFSLSTAAAHTFFGNNTASTAAPAYAAIGNGDLPGSGAITLNTTSPITGGGSVALGSSLTFACSACLTSVTAHNLLSATHGDTTPHTVLRGDLIAGIGLSPTWTAVAKGSTNTYPKWNSSGDVVASTNPASGTGACGANQFETTDNADASPTCAQPSFSNLSGSVAASQMPALTGDVTTTAGTVATTLATVASAGTGTKVTINAKGLSTAVTNATLASADFANQGTTTTLLHGNAAGNPSFSGVSLTADTSANQGTTTTVLHGNAAGQPSFASVVSGDLNITTTSCTNQYVSAISSGGVGTCTTDVLASAQHANQGTTTTVLHGNAAGNPSFTAVTSADTTGTFPATAHNLLSATHGDTTASSVARGGLITGQVGPVWAQLAKGTAGQCLQMDGTATDIIWGTCASGGSGITTLNTLTASTQTFATGTSGTDFNISSATSTHTFNIPDAGASARGLVTTGTQTLAGAKTLGNELTLAAATTSAASQNTPSGTAPTTPAAGDFWRDSTGFNMVENTSNNGAFEAKSTGTCAASDSGTVSFSAASNSAQVSENGGACQDIVEVSKTQTIQNKTLDGTDVVPFSALAVSAQGLRLLGCANITSAATSIGPITVSGLKIFLAIYIAGYGGGGDTAGLQFNASGGTAYRVRWLTSAAAGTTFASGSNTATGQDRIKIGAANTTLSRNVDAIINNDSGNTEKLVMFINGVFGTGSATTQATVDIGNGAWISAASTTITSISLISTQTMNANSKFCAYQAVP